MSVDFVTSEIIFAAHRNLAQNVWNYLSGGAELETTMRRNRFGLDSPGLSTAGPCRRLHDRTLDYLSRAQTESSRHVGAHRVAASDYSGGWSGGRQGR